MRTPRVRRRLAVVAGALASASLLAACGGASAADTSSSGGGSGSGARSPSTAASIPQLTQAIVSAFEKQTGIHVKVRSDDGIVLADQILQEGSHSPADVYLTENSPELMLLTEHQPAGAAAHVDHQPDPGPVQLADQ